MNTAERIQTALQGFNTQKMMLDGNVEVTMKLERYDYTMTHWNEKQGDELEVATRLFDAGEIDDEEVKAKIRQFRDASEVGRIDFAIKVLEPTVERFEQLHRLFQIERDNRVVAPAMENAERYKRLAKKLYDTLSLTTSDGNVATFKMRKQFDLFVSRTQNPSPEVLGLQGALLAAQPEKRLRQFEVNIEYDTGAVANAPKDEPEAKLEALDNSAFEAKLKPAPPEYLARTVGIRKRSSVAQPEPVEIYVEVSKQHPEFTEFCEQLYLQI